MLEISWTVLQIIFCLWVVATLIFLFVFVPSSLLDYAARSKQRDHHKESNEDDLNISSDLEMHIEVGKTFYCESGSNLLLLPCPFCGSSDIFLSEIRDDTGKIVVDAFNVSCPECQIDFSCGDSTAKDIATLWNRRVVNENEDSPEIRLSLITCRCDGDFDQTVAVEQIAPGMLTINNNESTDKSDKS